jgi:hypothetical protein
MNGTDDIRAKVGVQLVRFSAIALACLAVIVILGASFTKDPATVKDSAQLLVSSLLPVFGTWVGTVLAFYFSKENFEAANRGTIDLVRSVAQRLGSTRVTDVMTSRARMMVLEIPSGKTIADIKAQEVASKFELVGANGNPISRLPIIDGSGACIGFLHRSVWAEMRAMAFSQSQPSFDIKTSTLEPLLKMDYPLAKGRSFDALITQSIAYVARDVSVADAKSAMERVLNCQDVIVSERGTKTEPVLGWISNVDIIRVSQA